VAVSFLIEAIVDALSRLFFDRMTPGHRWRVMLSIGVAVATIVVVIILTAL
jgi:hypothetical protein